MLEEEERDRQRYRCLDLDEKGAKKPKKPASLKQIGGVDSAPNHAPNTLFLFLDKNKKVGVSTQPLTTHTLLFGKFA
uniref:Uncharacterized protein n=1 Tax=Megaselia scalaris TaxID=36166 RepID=T1GV05_MEGSC